MKRKQLSEEQIEQIVSKEVDAAEEYSKKRLPRRKESWDRYYGRKLGNEVKGRSKFITRDTMDTIEWMMPFLIRTFVSGDPKIAMKIKGQPAWVGQALFEKIKEDLTDNSPSEFLLFYQWFKDALVSDTAFVKAQYLRDIEKVDVEMTISPDKIQRLFDDPDVKVKNLEQLPGIVPQFKVKAVVDKTIEDRGTADNMPYWEFLTSPDARDINDEHPKGQKTTVTLDYLRRIDRANRVDKKPFFKGLDDIAEELHEEAPAYGYNTETSDGEAHTGYDGEPVDNERFSSRSIKTLEFVEWYTRIDVDGDGFLEDIVSWLVSGEKIKDKKLIRWELNKEGLIPISGIKPIIDCYKLYGISWADLVIEIQNLHTMLLRRILDNFDFQNSGRWIVDPEANVDLNSLLNNFPGSAIIGKHDGIKEVTPKGFMSGTFTILDYVKQLKENRTGVRDVNQGVPDPINQTLGGQQLIYSTAMQRLELIARIFAETGITDFYSKMGRLYQKYLKRPFTTETFGDVRTVTPQMIRGKIIMTVNMGVAANIGMQEAQKISGITGFLMGLNKEFPGLLGPDKIHNISRKYITSTGFSDVGEFIGDMKSYVEEYGKRMTSQQEHAKKMMELQKRMEDLDRMVKVKDIDAKTETEGKKIEAEEIDSQRGYDVNIKRIEAQKEKALTDAKVEYIDSQRRSKSESDKTEAQKEKTFMDFMAKKMKAEVDARKAKPSA